MGLLDTLDDPTTALAMGLLSAAGPSNRPVSLGQAMGAGYGQYQQARELQQQMLARKQAMQMQQMQMAGVQRQQSKEDEQEKFLADFVSKLPPDQQAIARMFPREFAAAILKPAEKAQLVTVAGPDGRPVQKWIRPGEANGVNIGLAPEKESAPPWYVKKGPDGKTMIDPAYAQFEHMKAANARPPAQPMQPVAYVDPATGQTVWGTITEARGKAAANYNPNIQAQIAGAKEAATTKAGAEAKRDVTMQGLSDIIGEAKSILTGKAGAKPTSSVIGAGVDAAASVIGVAPESANSAAKMKALGGALVMKMPRMEGPQSNYDQQLYREMAGDVGNPMAPISRRMAALDTIEKLNRKYAQPATQAKPGGATFLGFE